MAMFSVVVSFGCMFMFMGVGFVMSSGDLVVVNKWVGGSAGRLDEGVPPLLSPSSPVPYWLGKRLPPGGWLGGGGLLRMYRQLCSSLVT
jgi:hypothetical protein